MWVPLWLPPPAPSGLPGCAPHTPLSSAGPSAAAPWPARQPLHPRADSRTACRAGGLRSAAGGQWGRGVKTRRQVGEAGAPGGGCCGGTREASDRTLMCALPKGPSSPSPIPKLVSPQEPRELRAWPSQEFRTRGLREECHAPNFHHARASFTTMSHPGTSCVIICFMVFFRSVPPPLFLLALRN